MLSRQVKPFIRKYSLVVTKKAAEFNYIKNRCDNDSVTTEMMWVKNVDQLLEYLEVGYKELTIFFSDNLPTDILNNVDTLNDGIIKLPELSIVEIGENAFFKDCDTYINIEAIYDIEEDEDEYEESILNKEQALYDSKKSKSVDAFGVEFSDSETTSIPESSNKSISTWEESLNDLIDDDDDSTDNDTPDNIHNLREENAVSIKGASEIPLNNSVGPNDSIDVPETIGNGYNELLALNEELLNELENVTNKLSESELKNSELHKEYDKLKLSLTETTKKLENALAEYTSLKEQTLQNEEAYQKRLKELKDKEIQLSESINAFNKEVNSKKATSADELSVLRKLVENLESEITQQKEEIASLKLDNQAKFENAKEKNKEIQRLKEEIGQLNAHIIDLTSTMDNMGENLVSLDKLESLKDVLEEKDVEIVNLSEQIRLLKVENKKSEDNRLIIEEDLVQLREQYKELVANGMENKKIEYVEHELNGEINPTVFYFKIINQPPYMKSFLTTLEKLLKSKGKTLTIIIREEDYLTDKYYSGIPRYSNLDAVKEDDKVVMLTPSKFMMSSEDAFYSKYDSIIVVDYVRSSRTYLKGYTVLVIPTFISESEKELNNIKGLSLYCGTNSIIDMRYDSKYEVAETKFVRDLWLKKKVSVWLKSIGFDL